VLSSASSLSESTDSTGLDTAPAASQAPPEPEQQLSELIDRWLQEGDRLNDQAATADLPAPPLSRRDDWRERALELGRTVLDRHRLELLVGVGLLPLMLFLIAQPGRHHQAPPAPPARVAVARPAPHPAPAPAKPILLSEGLLRQCTAGPPLRTPAPARQPVAHRHKPAARRTAHAAPPPKTAPPKLLAAAAKRVTAPPPKAAPPPKQLAAAPKRVTAPPPKPALPKLPPARR
jgi:hypothetical protein